MTTQRQHWYLIAYDVRDPKRLRRVHYHIRKHAFALQESVFLVRTDQRGLAALEDQLRKLVDPRTDDLRRYPVTGPAALWTAGRQEARLDGLHDAATPTARERGRRGLFGLFGPRAA